MLGIKSQVLAHRFFTTRIRRASSTRVGWRGGEGTRFTTKHAKGAFQVHVFYDIN